MKKLLIAALVLILAGAGLIVAGYTLTGGDVTRFNSTNNHYIEKKYECDSKPKSITVNEKDGPIRIVPSPSDKVTVTYFDKDDKELYDITEEGSALTVTRTGDRGIDLFNFDFTDRATTIALPKDFDGDLFISDDYGSIKLSDIEANGIDIGNSFGSISLERVNAASCISVKNDSGSIKISSVEASGPIDITNENGSIKLEDLSSDSDLSISNGSGSITLERTDLEGALSIKGENGSIRFEKLRTGGDIGIENENGSIKGTIIGKESDYRVISDVKNGSNNLNSTSDGEKELKVSNSNGSVKIDFE